MPELSTYDQYAGTHWETGTVRNVLAQRGCRAPHTGAPYSEALLLGVSGGITVGYFVFAYEGYDPQCNILTRNTFDPLERLLSRLGVVQTVVQTRQAQRAADQLADILADGVPAIVWADYWSLPYNALPPDAGMWGAMPIVVYGFDTAADRVSIADRARVPLTVTTAELAAARGRVKNERFRMMTLEPPNEAKLTAAVRLGICDTLQLFTEKPPKGSVNNFGLRALAHWADMLRRPRQRQSWHKQFPAGGALYAGLLSAYRFAFLFGKDDRQDAERSLYADFLDEAALLLDKPALRDAADAFRASAAAWQALPAVLLADAVPPFGDARRLLWERHTAFLTQGAAAVPRMQAIDAQLAAIRATMDGAFPLDDAGVTDYLAALAAQVERIGSAESSAVQTLQAAMA